ncbi:MAG: AsmA family protein, partial [Desulfobacterales bacterium]
MLTTRTHKIAFMLLIGLLLLVVLAVAALFLVDPAVFRGQLEARATAAFGRQVQLDGPIRLERTLRPRIVIEDITIGNPDWATGAHFATAEKVGVQIALFPLLRGDLRVLDVSFTGVNLSIEKGADGANNYTFGHSGESKEPGVLPPIERLLIRNVTINYQTADAGISQYQIDEARLWNIPGEPERIEGKGSTKSMPFTILLVADTASELSGPQNPWSLKLDIKGPDMSLTLAGRMVEAFKWDPGDYRITISAKQADALETLFGLKFPTTGPFELSANLNTQDGSFSVTDIAARVHGLPETDAIKILQGETSGGPDDPLHIALQGQYGDAPFVFTFASAQPFEGTSQTTPLPLEAQLSIADTKLNIEGTIIPATAAERFEFDARLEGETLNTLAQLLDTELPQAGPYQLSFHTNIEAGSYTFTDLKGHIKGGKLRPTIGIAGGEISALESGSVQASIDARLDNIPLSLSFQGGPGASGKAGATNWPLKLEASASGATLTGEGSVVTSGNRTVLKMATRIKGNRFESLGPLIGASFPAIGKFNLSADVSSGGDVHAASNLQIQMGDNRLTGSVRWEDKAPRPFLTAELSTDRLRLNALGDPSSEPSTKTGLAGLLDRPIKLDWLKDVDAKLNLNVKHVADSPLPVENVKFAVALANGKLSAPFRGKLAGAPIDGQMHLSQPKNLPAVSLKAALGRIDFGQTLKNLEISDIVVGTADAVDLDGSSTGKTLRALGEKAAFNLQIKPANLSYIAEIANQTVDFEVESAKLVARKDQPLTGVFNGTLRGAAFNAEVSTANLMEIQKADIPLPVQGTLQTEDLLFKAEGTISRPFENNAFELQYELAGKEIERLGRLVNFALPLRGEFRARGRITGRASRFTFEENLRIGK